MNGYETINLTPMVVPLVIVHMKAKGRWQVLEWGKNRNHDYKFLVKVDNLTHREAQAFLKLMK
jgi:hypothetical protein